jgi:hypothetical protein
MPKLSEMIGGTPPAAAAAPSAGAGTGQRMKLSQVMAPPSAETPEPQPSVFRTDSDFRERTGLIPGQMMWAAAKDTFGSEQGTAEYLARKANEQLGTLREKGVKVVQGAGGEPLIELQDGTRYRLNDPGLDSADVGKLAANVAAFWTPAAWANRFGQARNLGLAGRSGTQAVTAATTDTVLQAGFDEGRVDPMRVAASGAGGAGGEVFGQVLGAVTRKVSQLLGRGVSSREAALTLAKDAGIPTPSPEILARLSSGLDEIKAGADPRAILGREQFGFLYTQGQRLADPVRRDSQLVREELLRQSPGSREVFQRMGTENAGRLDDAVARITGQFGGRGAQTPGEMAVGAGTVLRSQADDLGRQVGDAYDSAAKGSRAAVSADAIRALPDRLRGAVRDFDVNPSLTPATARTLEQIRNATAMLGSNVKGVTLGALETQRRILNNNIGATTNRADRAAMVTLKREFDGFVDEAMESALVNGDPAALDALKKARGLRAEYARRFEGGADSDRFIAGLLDGSRTPEELVGMALGATQVSKAGGARFIERLRVAAADDPAVMGNLRAAHFTRLSRGRNGETLTPGQIVRNIRETEFNNASVVKALYSPQEWAQVRKLADALEPMLLKGDLARTSGTIERAIRTLGQRIGGGLPFVGDMVQGAMAGRSYLQAGRAINAPVRMPAEALPGVAPAIAGTVSVGVGD